MKNLKLSEVMSRAKFLRFDGKNVLKYDLSNLEARADIEKVFNYFSGMVERMPKKSMFCILDMSGLDESVVSVDEMSTDMARHAAYFKAAAIIANDPKAIQLIKDVREILQIYLPAFKNEEEAVNWLLSLD